MTITAIDDLMAFLHPVEKIECVVFGHYRGYDWEYDREDDHGVPFNMRGTKLSWEEAAPFMRTWWRFNTGFGGADIFPVYIWTYGSSCRVIFVSEYDGSTRLSAVPRHPVDIIAEWG